MIKKYPMLFKTIAMILKFLLFISEYVARFLYLAAPIGLHLFVLNMRSKMDSVSAISTYTNEKSEFQHVYPGVIMVLKEPRKFKQDFKKILDRFNKLIDNYKYLVIVAMLILIVVGIYFII